MTNRYPGQCQTCSARVAADAGHYIDRVVYCRAHVPAAQAPRARFTLRGALVIVALVGYLGRELFARYQAAAKSAGARNVKAAAGWETQCQISQVPALAEALRAEGFVLDVEPALADALQACAFDAREQSAAAAERAQAADAVLAQSGLSLYPYQRVGAQWLAPRQAALLGDDMGLGKTVQALVAVPVGAPVLVVCPAVAKGVWVREAKRFRPDLTPVKLDGRGSFRWPVAGEMVVTNYDVLPGDASGKFAALPAELQTAPAGVVVIADECHRVKGAKTAQTKRFRALAHAARKADGRVWLLTATPMLNRPLELWTILVAAGLHRDAYGSWQGFCDAFDGHQGQYGYVWGTPKAAASERLGRVMLRRMKRDVLRDLPVKTHRDVAVNGLSAACKRACDAVLTALAARGIDLAKVAASAESSALFGAGFEQLSKARAELAAAKIPHAISLVEEFEAASEPVVVFSAHRAPIDTIGAREGWAAITGDTPAEERTQIEERFQRGELRGVAATIKAGGVAITLTRAAHAVFVDRDWTPALNVQAEDRIYRLGQSRGVQITHLVAEHALDEQVADLLAKKQALITASVDAAVSNDSDAPLEDLGSQYDEVAYYNALDAGRLAAAAVEAPAIEAAPRFRGPVGTVEAWAAAGLAQLAANDPDHAAVENGVGFNQLDGSFGHSLAAQLAERGGLSDAKWMSAIRMLKKYHGQIGQCPSAAADKEVA